MNPLHFPRANRLAFFFNADKGGSTGGDGGKKTDLELLEEARQENTRLKGDLATAQSTISTLNTDLDAARTTATDLQKKLTASEQKVTGLEASVSELNGKLTAETGKVTAAEKERDTAKSQLTEAQKETARITEHAARHGIVAPSKTTARDGNEEKSDLKGRAKAVAAINAQFSKN